MFLRFKGYDGFTRAVKVDNHLSSVINPIDDALMCLTAMPQLVIP